MNQGFFDLGTGADLSTKQVASGKIGCDSCGMHHDCDTPKFKKKIIGKAELPKILIVLENPSQVEDEKGIPLSGDSGSYLRTLLKDNLSEEEYNEIIVTYAVRCAGKVSDKSIADCSQQLRKDIHNLEPSVIIPMGTVAVKAVLGDYISGRLSGIQYDSYYGEIIPAKKYRICPTFPHWMVFAQKDKDINYEKAFISHIQKACSLFDRKVFDFDAHFKKQYTIECLKDEKEIKKALKYFLGQEVVAFDYETTGIKPHGASHRLVSCSIADDKRAVAFPVSEEISEELRAFLKSGVKKVSHNLAFEDAWSWYKLGVQVENWYWDTMIGCHCLHNKKPTGLKFAVFSKFGITYDSEVDKYLSSSEEENSEKGANGLNKILLAPLDELLYYNALDSLYTFQLYLSQKREFEERSYLKQGFDFFMKGVQALAQVQRNGIRLDSGLLKKQDKELTGLIERKFEEIMDSSEVKLWKNKQKFNPDSNTDLDILLYKMLGNKRPKSEPCEEKALLKIGGEFCSNILQYRKWKKTRDTYLGQFKREVCNDFVYPFFSLHLVTSFRSSSSNPNFQNIPKRDKEAKNRVRSLLKPHPGCRLVEYDYKGVEVTVSAAYHKDKNMIKYLLDSKNDMHRDTAGDICLKDPKDITKDERQLGKNGFVFPAFYGSTFRSMAPAIWEEIEKMPDLLLHLKSEGIKTFEKFEKHIEKVEKIFWGERFAQYNAWKQRIWKEYQNKGRLRSFTGFEYQMPMKFTEATNYCIQGSAFHCLLYTLIHVQEELQKGKCPKSCIMGQIHDSLVCSIHPEDAEEFDEMVKRIGTQQIQKEFDWLVVPLVIEKEQGSIDGDWTTLEEVKIW